MKKLFGVGKKKPPKEEGPPPPSLKECSDNMGGSISKLQEKVKECNQQLAEVKAAIKKAGPTSKRMYMQRAQNILKRRKMYEQQLGHHTNQQFNVDMMAFNQESIQMTIDTSKALKAGVAAQKVQMKEINLDDLEDLQEDMMEMMEDQEEIQEIMGQNFATDEVDEGELLDELAMLDEDDLLNDLEDLGEPAKAEKAPELDLPAAGGAAGGGSGAGGAGGAGGSGGSGGGGAGKGKEQAELEALMK